MMTPAAMRMAMVALAATSISGCGRPSDDTAAASTADIRDNASIAKGAQPPCAPGAALPLTGLCPSEVAALVLSAPGTQAAAPDGCGWTVAEAAVSAGSVLLYRAARCQAGTARLALVPGATTPSFTLAVSPYGDQPDTSEPMAQMHAAADQQAIAQIARRSIDDPAERSRCHTRQADMESWPADALVVDEVPVPEADGIRSACGVLGLDQGAQTFWRISQGVAWFFRLGQESPVVDPGSFTLVKRDGNGHWERAR